MGSYAARFTPQLMLSAPQRSAGVSNPSGTTILYTTSSYSLQDHFHTVGLEALRVHTGQTFEIDAHQELSNPCWLDDECFFCLRAEEGGRTSVLQGFVYQPEQDQSRTTLVTAGSINAKATNMKMARIGNEFDDIAIVVTALAGRRGTLLTDENVTRKTHSSGRLYDGLFVRHWDRFEGPGTNSLWYGRLRPVEGAQYKLGKLTNLLTAARLGTPIQSFGGLDTFDIRADAIIWIARDFEMNPSTNTKCNIYIQHMVSWGSEQSFQNPRPERIDVEGFDGAAASAVFAPIGNKAAFLKMRINRYESDKNQIFVVPDVTVSKPEAVRLLSSSENSEYEGSWDRSPRSICFGASGDYLAVTADDHGHCRAFHIDLSPEMQNCRPRPLIHAGMATRLQCLNDGRIFASGTSFVDDSWYAIVDPSIVDATDSLVWSHSYSDQGANLGLQRLQVQSIRTPASDPSVNSQIHSWIFKPSNFDGTQSYPVAYLIHGGPHESWKDSWSTRWNPAVFAEQGYIVVASNPSGSTGYGQAFTNASIQNWGGAPYEDIVNVFDWVGQNVQGADNDRAVALGHSYGGYMVNHLLVSQLARYRTNDARSIGSRATISVGN